MSLYPEFKTLRVCRERSRLYVNIHRPEAKNALSDEVVDELTSLVELASADKTLRAWIMRAAKGRFARARI